MASITQSRPRWSNEKVIGLMMSGSLANSSSLNSAGCWMNFIESSGENGIWYFGAGSRFS